MFRISFHTSVTYYTAVETTTTIIIIRLFSHKSLPAVAATTEPLPIRVHMVAAVPPFPPVYLCPNLLLYIVVVIIIFNILFSIRPTFVCTQTPNGE